MIIPVLQYSTKELSSSATFFANIVGSNTNPTKRSELAKLNRSLVDGLRISVERYRETINTILSVIVGRISKECSDAATMYTVLTWLSLLMLKVRKLQCWTVSESFISGITIGSRSTVDVSKETRIQMVTFKNF